MDRPLTPAELVVLGLIAERPRHGYELDRVIEERGMREWTDVAFSSVYYLLRRLERQRLIRPVQTAERQGRRRTFTVTSEGLAAARTTAKAVLRDAPVPHPPVLVGIANLPLLDSEEALGALRERATSLSAELQRLTEHPRRQLPAPLFVAAIFDYGLGALRAELDWVERTINLMEERNVRY